MIPFNIPLITGKENLFVKKAIEGKYFSGNGNFSNQCQNWLETNLGSLRAMLTPSCTHALEMAAILANIQPNDEVIMSSFTFVSTANAFVLRGAKIVFVDVRPDTMNIDENLIELAITDKTKAIVAVHYGGVACEMDLIMQIAKKHQLLVIEDAAQSIGSTYKNKPLGTIGHLGCLSFHETKNIHCGEGGALLINDKQFIERAEIIREKGTNRNKFLSGQVDKYTWVDLGSSYLPSELNAAFLMAQLTYFKQVNAKRMESLQIYQQLLAPITEKKLIELQLIPNNSISNGHLFYIKLENIDQRNKMLKHLNEKQIQTVFHYVPLHSSKAGQLFGRFYGTDQYTTDESERLLRLPMYFSLSEKDQKEITKQIISFFN